MNDYVYMIVFTVFNCHDKSVLLGEIAVAYWYKCYHYVFCLSVCHGRALCSNG